RHIRLTRAHLEEDAGKNVHDESGRGGDSRVDLNRTGTPLLEIVSEPDMRSPQEARAYLSELKLLLTYLGVSDCNMEEGSLRVDANINLHIAEGDETIPTPIVEIKNVNSFRNVERALEYEARRQFQVWRELHQRMGDAPKTTRGWDDQTQQTKAQREKEESSDYRYFPDPDLAPVLVPPARVDAIKAALGQSPRQLRERLQSTYDIDPYDADVIVNQGRAVVNYFESVAGGSGDGKRAANWIQQDVLRTLKERSIEIEEFPMAAARLVELLQEIDSGKLTTTRAKDVFQHMLETNQTAAEAMADLGIEAVAGSEMTDLCQQLLDDNPRIVADVRGGKQQAVGALIGQAKKRNPNVNPGEIRRICLELIDAMPDE
ncbi:MAG: Asp-tRNA(Asn)/Glu-tRNA(Gln) amidotransferase subunit GatB, partial [Pirellulaceae bacterium]|nr:Asp-tRNA(Asn)/Glu-tRNA(Gln) amidotransferase subunit GatB [Pirellulaceae bacterium]